MKILTTKDFIEGKIPRIEDFIPALEQFESDCVDPFIGKEVVGSFAYGSVNRDDYNVASDIDYFMIISDENHKKKVRESTKRAYDEKNVYVQTRVINQEHAKSGFHTFDEPFRQHLELSVAKYGHKGKNPLEILALNNVPFRYSLRKSILVHLMKLNNGFTTSPTSEEEYVDFLKDIMEKPFHAMRCAIQYALGTVAPNGAENFHDTKEELIRTYNTLGFDGDLTADIGKLISTAKDYVRLLGSRQRGDIPQNELKGTYSVMLDRIMICYPESYHFICENAKFMKN